MIEAVLQPMLGMLIANISIVLLIAVIGGFVFWWQQRKRGKMLRRIDLERLSWRIVCGLMFGLGLSLLGCMVYFFWVEIIHPIISAIRETPSEGLRIAGIIALVLLVCFLIGWIADRLGFVPPIGEGAVEALKKQADKTEKEN